MSIYNNKHCVFEEVGVEGTTGKWNTASNVDGDGANNDWNISTMRNTHLPAKLLLLSSALQAIINATTIQTATNGNNGALVSTSDKLFLAAEKEMRASPSLARSEESFALTTWTYWTTHTSSSNRIKYDVTSTAQSYWLRSPYSGGTSNVVYVRSNGGFSNIDAGSTIQLSPCFAF